MTTPLRSRFRFALIAALALMPLACGRPSCRGGCVQSEEWVEFRHLEPGIATVTFMVANMKVLVDEQAFREVANTTPTLKPKGRAIVEELLDKGEPIQVGPGTRSIEARCFWMLTKFIETGAANVSLDETLLSRIRVRNVLYGNPEEWTANWTREYWTEGDVRLLEFVTAIQ